MNEMPEKLQKYIESWLQSNEMQPDQARHGSFPLGMVNGWIDRAERAEQRLGHIRQIVEGIAPTAGFCSLMIDDDGGICKKPGDWRIGLSVKPKFRNDDLYYERGIVLDILPSGTNGLEDPTGVLKIKMGSGNIILRKADDWVTA